MPGTLQQAFGIGISRSVSYLAAPSFAAALLDRAVVATIPVDRHALLLAVRDAPTAVAAIVTAATAAGMTLEDVEISRPNLESVFLRLTGKALRD